MIFSAMFLVLVFVHNQYGYPQAVHAQGSKGRKAEVPLRNAVP